MRTRYEDGLNTVDCTCSNEHVTSKVCTELDKELSRGKEHGLGQTLSHKPGALSSGKIGMLKNHWSLLKVTLLHHGLLEL